MDEKRQKTQYIQLELAFMGEQGGEAPRLDQQGIESPMARREPESPADDQQLMEEICERENLST